LPMLSANGRYAAFVSGPQGGVSVHDRLTGFTEELAAGAAPQSLAISADGQVVAFDSVQALLPEGTNNTSDVFVVSPAADCGGAAGCDLNGDGDISDTVLQVYDTRTPDEPPRSLGPADQVAVFGGRAAFLMPEAMAGTDRNGDGDTRDSVV